MSTRRVLLSALTYVVVASVIFVGGITWYRTHFSQRDAQENIENVTSNLETPEQSFAFCRRAFRKNSADQLRHCLSSDLLARYSAEGDDFVHLWQLGFSVCGGYGRKPTEVIESDEEAYVYFTPIDGCINSMKLVRQNGLWKFDETGEAAQGAE